MPSGDEGLGRSLLIADIFPRPFARFAVIALLVLVSLESLLGLGKTWGDMGDREVNVDQGNSPATTCLVFFGCFACVCPAGEVRRHYPMARPTHGARVMGVVMGWFRTDQGVQRW